MKKILVLGTGFVSRPGIEYLLKQKELFVTAASNELAKAQNFVQNRSNGKAVYIDINNTNDLSDLIAENDIIISLLPWIYHVKVAELCVANNKHMATTSYVSEGMRLLEKDVKEKGLTFLNEMGVDPGIDHMSAMSVIHKVHSEGGKILHFYSYCGGLPAPEDNDNPFGYKFSWSPRGVVLASRNSARFLENGRVINIEGKDLFLNCITEEIEGLGTFEVYPNRDSIPYRDVYGIDEALTIKRGTYRNIGWCETLKKIVDLGLVDHTPREKLNNLSFKEMMLQLLGCNDDQDVRTKTAEKLNLPNDSEIINRMEWLGLFSDEKTSAQNNYLDILSDRLQQLLVYKDGEKDMLLLRHRFIVENKDSSRDEITSTMIDYGIPFGDSSMARTVSLPMAIGVKLLADGRINIPGILIPTKKEIYSPVLEELAGMNIRMVEKRTRLT